MMRSDRTVKAACCMPGDADTVPETADIEKGLPDAVHQLEVGFP